MFTSITNLVNSAISTIHNPDAVESYDFSCTYPCGFKTIVEKFMNRFRQENLTKHNIVSCEVVRTEKKDDVTYAKREIKIDISKTIPSVILNYFSDSIITLEHLMKLDVKNKMMIVTIKNITHPSLTFNETQSFVSDEDTTKFTLAATLSVNIFFGVNETIRKLWHMRYKSYYENENFVKKLLR